ncbi:MAG: dUTP diphosphatase [Oscillospiraceae bacterium]|jgi:dUTP pyrophosphatase|nr:dUTP diphosphatase [Oscillospiraceae bacterium]
MTVKVKKTEPGAKLPFRATEHSAGADLFALLEKDAVLESGSRVLVPTGIAVEIPPGYGGFVFPRSSVSSKHGVSLANCVGVIDADYRGEVKIPLINHGKETYAIKNGDRIAQMVIMPVKNAEFIEVGGISDTERGAGGFGSTGL